MVVSDPFMAAVAVLENAGIRVVTIEQLLTADPIDPVEAGEDDLALLQLTSGSTGSPKAVQITHRNLVSNAEAMFVGAEYNMDTDVIVSWLPLFHDMGMTGFLIVPMYFGAELVKVTPMDFLRDTLVWARLIDKYQGTMTAAPNFAYSLFAKRLRRQAQPGQFDLSTLRWALSGAEPVEPADVEDLCEAGAPFGLKPEAILPAYGMAETTVAVSFSECGGGLVVDEIDADLLAALRRAVPATMGNTRRLATLGPLLGGLEARIVDEVGNVLPTRGVGVIELRGEPVTRGYITMCGFVPTQDERGWYDTGDLGYLTENGHIVVCGRVKDVVIMAGRSIYPTDVERAAARVEVFVRGVRSRCAWTQGTRGNLLPSRWSPTRSTIPSRCAGSNIRSPTRWSPRLICGRATSWCWARGPSRKPRPASFAAAARSHCSANRAASPTVFTSRPCDRRLPTQRGSSRGRELPSAPFQL